LPQGDLVLAGIGFCRGPGYDREEKTEMNSAAPSRQVKTRMRRVKDPTGRVDLLIARLLAEAVRQTRNPVLAAIHKEVAPHLEKFLKAKLGPRNRHVRKLRECILRGNRMIAAQRQERVA
jgi:hypothetical protein